MEANKESTNKIIKWEPINFVFYLSFVKWPVLLAIIFEIMVRLWIARFYDDLSLDRVDLLMWLIRLVLFIIIGRKIGKVYGQAPAMGALSGAVAGIVLGLAIAGFRFFSGFKVWKIFNLPSEIILTAIIGALVAFLIVYLWDLWPKKKSRLIVE